jgi:two-component system, NarL family, invasion response regulator UvrY
MIVDDHDRCAALRDLVAAAPGFELVAEAASGEHALTAAREHRPMLVLIDVQMPGIGGLEAARRLAREDPATVVVLMSTDPDPRVVPEAYGAVALVHKRDLRPGSLAPLWSSHSPGEP